MKYKYVTQDSDGWIKAWKQHPEKLDNEGQWIGDWDCIKSCCLNSTNFKPLIINLETHDYKIKDGILMKVDDEYSIKPKTKVVLARMHVVGTSVKVEYENTIRPFHDYKWIGDWQEVELPNE